MSELYEMRCTIADLDEKKKKIEAENADLRKRNGNMNHGMAKDILKIATLEAENVELKKQVERLKDVLESR